MNSNGLKFWMLSQANDWPLPSPAPAAPDQSSLALVATPTDTSVVMVAPLPGTPAFVSIDSEILAVTAIDHTGLQLTVTRGAEGSTATQHPPGALVLGPVALLQKPAAEDDPQITISAASPLITPGTFLQIGAETLAVTAVDGGGLLLTVTRGVFGSTASAYDAGSPVFEPIPSDALYYCTTKKRLRLASMRIGNPPVEVFTQAETLVATVPMARDTFGNYARWDAAATHVVAGGSGPGEVTIYTPPVGQAVTDLTLGLDGILYIAVGGNLVMVDRRGRWPDFALTVPGFTFWRLAAISEGGVLALDRDRSQLGKVTGAPLQTGPVDTPNPGIMRSCAANADPPRMERTFALPAGESFVALAACGVGLPSGAGQKFVLLSWAQNSPANTASFLRLFDFHDGAGSPWKLNGIVWPYGVTSLSDSKAAVLVTSLNEALVFDLSEEGTVLIPAGDSYILSGVNKGPFAHTLSQPPYYADGTQLKPLLPLSLNSLAGFGSTDARAPKIIDSGKSQTVWHRLFLEAVIPTRCSVVVWLAAAETPAGITAASTSWYAHAFGDADMTALPDDTPQGVWLSIDSEAPFAQTLLGETPAPDRTGLFMALVQRTNRAVRNLTGRFLGVRVELHGDRRSTPEIAALRAWASRYSYVSNYLPELYREQKFGVAADQTGNSSRRDFFERFVNIFEAQLTRIEDRVANAHLLTRPESTTDDALDWLGGWLGFAPSAYPPDRRRARLLAAPDLRKKRGTAPGITQAIDIATNGLCSRGAVIVIEDFRLRHTFATILGANLAITNDPLLPGYSPSSNSFVGDSLFLGNPRDQAEVLALFNAPESTAEQTAVQEFYDSLANRLTIFIHNQVETVDINLVQKIVDHEKPAHIAATIRIASQPLMIGLASLLGVDTYLAPEPPRDPVVVGSSQIGRYNMVIQAPSLDPRLET